MMNATVCRLDGDSRAYMDVFTACPSMRVSGAQAGENRRFTKSTPPDE